MNERRTLLKTYFKEIRQQLTGTGKARRRLLHSLKTEIAARIAEQPDISFQRIVSEFGEPEEIAEFYMAAQEPVKDRKRTLLAGLAVGMVLLLGMVIVLFTSGVLSQFGQAASEAVSGDNLSSSRLPTLIDNYYLLPSSSQRLLTSKDVEKFTDQDLLLAQHEIYARHGMKFDEADIQSYFSMQSWYQGSVAQGEFREEQLSSIEQDNLEFLAQYVAKQNPVEEPYDDEDILLYDEYILPQSSERLLISADIAQLTKTELMLARNEIFARYGRTFGDEDVQSFFNSRSWYTGDYASAEFDETQLSAVEWANIQMLLEAQNK